jgi:hypothetical protein
LGDTGAAHVAHCGPGFDNVGLSQADLLEVLPAIIDDIGTVIPELMDSEERAAFEALPDELVIYRFLSSDVALPVL